MSVNHPPNASLARDVIMLHFVKIEIGVVKLLITKVEMEEIGLQVFQEEKLVKLLKRTLLNQQHHFVADCERKL